MRSVRILPSPRPSIPSRPFFRTSGRIAQPRPGRSRAIRRIPSPVASVLAVSLGLALGLGLPGCAGAPRTDTGAPAAGAVAPRDVAAAPPTTLPAAEALSPPTERAPTPAAEAAPSPWSGGDGLLPVDIGDRGRLLVRPDHGLGRYDALRVERVGFRYRMGQHPLPPRAEQRIAAMLTRAVEGGRTGILPVSEEPGLCVLSVVYYVTDLALYGTELPVGSHTAFVRSFGEATMVLELQDSLSGRALARFQQRRDLGGGFTSTATQSGLQRLGIAIGASVRDMGQQLIRIMPVTLGPTDDRCAGAMSRVALGSH